MGIGSRLTVFSSQRKETYYYITSGWPRLFVRGRRYFGSGQALLTGKNGAEARRAVGGSGGPAEYWLIG